METRLKDIIHLYLGCRLKLDDGAYCDLTPSRLSLIMQTNKPERYKPILRPLSDMKIEEGAWCLKETFFDNNNYPLSNFRIELVGASEKNPRVSIDNDWYNVSLTFGNGRGSVWGIDQPAQNVKIQAIIFSYLLKQGFDLFSLIPNGYAIDRATLPSLTNNKNMKG